MRVWPASSNVADPIAMRLGKGVGPFDIKTYFEDSGGRPRTTRQFAIDSEFERFEMMYPLFEGSAGVS
jgi:hypothetical protein